MYRLEGVRGLFKGNGVNLMVQAPFTAFEFFFYEVFKNNLFPGTSRQDLTYSQKLACGGLTGQVGTLIIYPLDVIKTYITVDDKSNQSIYRRGADIVKAQGIRGMYKGLGLSLFGITPFIAIRMSSFDTSNQFLKSKARNESQRRLASSLAGAIGGLAAVIVCYPMDTVRRLLHLNGTSPEHSYKGLADACLQTYRKLGILGFYRGFMVTIIKTIP